MTKSTLIHPTEQQWTTEQIQILRASVKSNDDTKEIKKKLHSAYTVAQVSLFPFLVHSTNYSKLKFNFNILIKINIFRSEAK